MKTIIDTDNASRFRSGSIVGLGMATAAAVAIGLVGGTATAQAQPAPPETSTAVAAADTSVIYLDTEAIAVANSLAVERGEPTLPPEVRSVIIAPEGLFAADADGNQTVNESGRIGKIHHHLSHGPWYPLLRFRQVSCLAHSRGGHHSPMICNVDQRCETGRIIDNLD